MVDELATVEFTAGNYMVFWDGEVYQDGMTHEAAVELCNKLNEDGVEL